MKSNTILVVALFFLLGAKITPICGQPNAKDSLKKLLNTGLGNIARADVLNQLAFQYYDFDDSIGLGYANEALVLSKQLKYDKGIKYAYTMIGLGFSSQSLFNEAKRNFILSDKVSAVDSESDAAYNLVLLGNVYRDIANYDSALLMYGKAKALHKKNIKVHLSIIYKNIAIIKIFQWKNKEALALMDSASLYIQKEDALDHYIQMDIWSIYGQAYKNILQYDLSQMYYEKMCDASSKLDDNFHQIMCKLNKTELAYERGDFTSALKFGFEALDITQRYVYPPQYAKVLIQIGEIYTELSQYDFGSEYFHKALAVTERFGLQAETALAYAELGWIKKDQGDFSAAIDYTNKSLSIRTAIGDTKGIANCHNILGLIYLLQKDYAKSLSEQQLALVIREKLAYAQGISASIFNLSLVYVELNQIDKALEYQRKAIVIEEGIDNKQSLAISYNTIASLLLKIGKPEEALSYTDKANKLASETGSILLKRNNANIYAAYFEKVGNYKKALEFQKLYQKLNDSVYSETSAIKLAESEALYNVEKKEKNIEILEQKHLAQANQLLLQEAEIARKNWVILSAIVGICIFAVISIFAYQMYKDKSRANRELREQQEEIQAQSEELQEANQAIADSNKGLEEKIEIRTSELRQAYKELDTFFYRSSHDFRRPITTFLGLAGVAKITVKDVASLELFEKVSETAMSLDKMLQKLQSISDVGAHQMVFKEVFLQEQINEVTDSFATLLHQKKITLSKEIKSAIPFVSYPAMVKIIIDNLVENAIYFSGTESPFLTIKASIFAEVAIIEIEDNGQGIMDEYKSRIFEMYFRANERSKGNGLGLYIAKKAVEKLNGKIRFTSQYNVGSLFTVEIPNLS